jgi:hypothetical protein
MPKNSTADYYRICFAVQASTGRNCCGNRYSRKSSLNSGIVEKRLNKSDRVNVAEHLEPLRSDKSFERSEAVERLGRLERPDLSI